MTQQPLVSVVVPTHNMARFVAEAVTSVLNQTHRNLEVHVVDDGSTDNPREAVLPLMSDPRVVFHSQPNGGQAKAKNRGIRASRGEFIAFLDADDLWVPDKIEKQLPQFTRPEIGVVYTNYRWIDINGVLMPTPPVAPRDGRITNELFVTNFVTGMASIVRRECFDAVGVFNESLPMSIDWDLWLRISSKYEFKYFDYVTYLYRQWPGQMSKNFETRFHCAVRVMKQFLDEHPGLIEPSTASLAWAHTYSGFGENLRYAGRFRDAMRSYADALRVRPTYLPAWKGLVRCVQMHSQS